MGCGEEQNEEKPRKRNGLWKNRMKWNGIKERAGQKIEKGTKEKGKNAQFELQIKPDFWIGFDAGIRKQQLHKRQADSFLFIFWKNSAAILKYHQGAGLKPENINGWVQDRRKWKLETEKMEELKKDENDNCSSRTKTDFLFHLIYG